MRCQAHNKFVGSPEILVFPEVAQFVARRRETEILPGVMDCLRRLAEVKDCYV
jgi:hypothetical protein